MGFQLPGVNKLEDDKEQIFTNVDFPVDKSDPHHVVLVIPDNNRKLDNNESFAASGLHTLTSENDTRKEILRSFSSFVVSIDVFLALFYQLWVTLLPLQTEHIHSVSIWSSVLGLFGFVVFICAIAVMILVGGVFTPMQKAMLITLLVLMHLQSANSIIEVCVILLGGVFMAWYAFWKEESPDNENDIKSSNMLANKLSAQTIV